MKTFIATLLFAFAFTIASASDTATLSLQVGGMSKYGGTTVKDKVTGAVLTATITNLNVTNNNPELATIVQNPSSPTGVKATPIAAGSGTATVTCDVSYIDPGDGLQKNESKSVVIQYAVAGTPHGVSLSLTFN